jgi:hypothetical protein
MKVKGNINVAGKIDVGTRLNNGFSGKDLSSAETLTPNSAYWQKFTLTGAQDVNLPDATELNNAWEVVIYNADTTDTLSIKNDSGDTVQTVAAGKAYKLTLQNNSTASGDWYVHILSSTELLAADRYSATFNATTDWTDGGTEYTRTILASTHGKGTTPTYIFEELNGSDFELVMLNGVSVNSSGDIEFSVTKTPDARFSGRIIVL